MKVVNYRNQTEQKGFFVYKVADLCVAGHTVPKGRGGYTQILGDCTHV